MFVWVEVMVSARNCSMYLLYFCSISADTLLHVMMIMIHVGVCTCVRKSCAMGGTLC